MANLRCDHPMGRNYIVLYQDTDTAAQKRRIEQICLMFEKIVHYVLKRPRLSQTLYKRNCRYTELGVILLIDLIQI